MSNPGRDDHPVDFPRLAQDATADQIERAVAYLATLPLADLRGRQRIHAQQIQRAIEQGKDEVARSEQIKFDMTTDAVSRATFGQPMHGLHTDATADPTKEIA